MSYQTAAAIGRESRAQAAGLWVGAVCSLAIFLAALFLFAAQVMASITIFALHDEPFAVTASGIVIFAVAAVCLAAMACAAGYCALELPRGARRVRWLAAAVAVLVLAFAAFSFWVDLHRIGEVGQIGLWPKLCVKALLMASPGVGILISLALSPAGTTQRRGKQG